jgi:hypothetical protein
VPGIESIFESLCWSLVMALSKFDLLLAFLILSFSFFTSGAIESEVAVNITDCKTQFRPIEEKLSSEFLLRLLQSAVRMPHQRHNTKDNLMATVIPVRSLLLRTVLNASSNVSQNFIAQCKWIC